MLQRETDFLAISTMRKFLQHLQDHGLWMGGEPKLKLSALAVAPVSERSGLVNTNSLTNAERKLLRFRFVFRNLFSGARKIITGTFR